MLDKWENMVYNDSVLEKITLLLSEDLSPLDGYSSISCTQEILFVLGGKYGLFTY